MPMNLLSEHPAGLRQVAHTNCQVLPPLDHGAVPLCARPRGHNKSDRRLFTGQIKAGEGCSLEKTPWSMRVH